MYLKDNLINQHHISQYGGLYSDLIFSMLSLYSFTYILDYQSSGDAPL